MSSQCQSLVGEGNRANGVDFDPDDSAQVFEDDVTLDVLISQIGFIRSLSESADMDDLSQRLSAVLIQLGFSDFIFIRMSSSWTFDAPINSLPSEFMESYRAEFYARDDMILDYLKTGNAEPVYHSEIDDAIQCAPILTQGFKRNLDMLALYKLFGFNDAYCIPVTANRGKCDDRVMLSVMAKGKLQEEFATQTESSSSVLRLLADAINFICDTKFSTSRQKSTINPRPMRLLTLMAKQDLSLGQAARELCISLDTANKHMAMAKKALNTRSQANAVYLAIQQGLIEFS